MISRFIHYRRISRQDGFTLFEIIVVMVIIAMMTAFTIPEMRSSLFSDELKTSTRKILAVLSEASQEAVRRHADYSLYFDLDKNSISSLPTEEFGVAADEVPAGQSLDIPESIQLVDIESAHGGKQTLGQAVIRFTKKGYVDKTLIHLRTEDGDDMTILLSPFIGVTKVFDSYLDLEDERIRY